MQAISGAVVMKTALSIELLVPLKCSAFPKLPWSVLNFIFKSAINHRAELEINPSAIKAPEQSLFSPASIVWHSLTSGNRKLPDVLTLQLLAPAGILTATICTGERLQKNSSPSPITYVPQSTKSYYTVASEISAGFTFIDGRWQSAKVPFLSASILQQGASWQSLSVGWRTGPLHLLLFCMWFIIHYRKAFSHAIKFSLDAEGDQECLGWRKNSLLGY